MRYFDGFVFKNIVRFEKGELYSEEECMRIDIPLVRVMFPVVQAPGIYSDNCAYIEPTTLFFGKESMALLCVTQLSEFVADEFKALFPKPHLRMADKFSTRLHGDVSKIVSEKVHEHEFFTVTRGLDGWIVTVYRPGESHPNL